MARPAEWIHRLDTIRGRLAQLTAPTLDRRAIQLLFGVSPRQALRILHRFTPHQAGQALLIGRAELAAHLDALAEGAPEVRGEQTRHASAVAEIKRLAAAHHARNHVLAAPSSGGGQPEAGWSQLSAGIRLSAGKLEITFQSGEELLTKLLELAQAVAADPEQFRELTEACNTL